MTNIQEFLSLQNTIELLQRYDIPLRDVMTDTLKTTNREEGRFSWSISAHAFTPDDTLEKLHQLGTDLANIDLQQFVTDEGSRFDIDDTEIAYRQDHNPHHPDDFRKIEIFHEELHDLNDILSEATEKAPKSFTRYSGK